MPVLLAILVGCGAAVLLIAALRRRSATGGPSIDRYHHAMDVLAGLSDPPAGRATRRREAAAPLRRPIEAVTEELPVLPPHEQVAPAAVGRRPRARRVLPAGLAAAAALAVGLGLALTSTPAAPGRHLAAAPREPATAPAAPAATAPAPSLPRSPATSAPTAAPSSAPGASAASSPTTPAVASTGAPVLAALDPPSAAPGQTVALVGSGFTSPDGVVVATFGGQAAPTRCPSGGRCLVTVPARAAGTAVVQVRTDAGSSNGLPFSIR